METFEVRGRRAAGEGPRRGGPGPARRALGAVRAIFVAPFRGDPEQMIRLSADELERRRRAALLRLILVCVAGVSIGFLLPSTLLGHAAAADLWRLGLVIALALACLVLNGRRRTTLAGALFIYGTLVLVLHFIATTASGVDQPLLLTCAQMSLLILVGGLIFPAWLTWATTALMVGITLAAVLALPLAPQLVAAGAVPATVRFGAAGPLVTLQVFVAVFSWVAARSARSGIETARRAVEREHELTALKDQFIIDANHELRTPIMALYGNLEILQGLGEGASAEQRAALLDRALRSGDAVLRLLGSVLDTSVLEAGAPRLTPIPLGVREVVMAVLRTFDPREIGEPGLAEGQQRPRPVRVHVPVELVALADEVRLRQILINLLSNALKYSPPESPLVISARAVSSPQPGRRITVLPRGQTSPRPVPSRYVLVSVRDRGLGIPPGDAPKLFNRFVRLPRDIAGPVRGTGLGLYLCRTLIEAMGGRIWVESTGAPGDGSTFAFTLPAAPALAPASTDPGEAAPATHASRTSAREER